MNRWNRTAITALLLVFSLSGCAVSQGSVTGTLPGTAAPVSAASGESVSEAALMETLFSSYYEGQDSHAFEMLHKKIFSRLIRHWTDAAGFSAASPAWAFDSFTRYDILDPELRSIATQQEIYCCGFSSPDGGSGYFVLSYDGNSLCNLKAAETPYPYDLNANLKAIIAGLEGTSLDLSSISANRVRLDDPETGRSMEAIRFTDSAGRTCFGLFEEDGIVFSGQAPFSTEA